MSPAIPDYKDDKCIVILLIHFRDFNHINSECILVNCAMEICHYGDIRSQIHFAAPKITHTPATDGLALTEIRSPQHGVRLGPHKDMGDKTDIAI